MDDTIPHLEDYLLAQNCLSGDARAIQTLQRTYGELIYAYLRKAGGAEHEAREVTDGLWADLLAQRENAAPRLANYQGRAALSTWLYPVALNRLMLIKRAQERQELLAEKNLTLEESGGVVPAPETDTPLMELLHEAVQHGFRQCDPEHFVMALLSYIDGLYLEELAKMFQRPRATIHRHLGKATEEIGQITTQYIKERDSWLTLRWEDYLLLCSVMDRQIFGLE